jgi:hypothetical protein
MTQKSSVHLAKAIKNIYNHIDKLDKSNASELKKDILETIIDHLNLLIQVKEGAK